MSLPSWARVGAKVVCICHAWETGPGPAGLATGPAHNEICTISGFDFDDYGNRPGLRLLGYSDPSDMFTPDGFRPLVTLEDDITTYFSELLNVSTPQRVEA